MAYETPQEQATELLATGLIQPAQTVAQQAAALLATGEFQPAGASSVPAPVSPVVNNGTNPVSYDCPPNSPMVVVNSLVPVTLPVLVATQCAVTLVISAADTNPPTPVSVLRSDGVQITSMQGQGTSRSFYPDVIGNTWLVY